MVSITLTIKDPIGLHAVAVAKMVKTANSYSSNIKITLNKFTGNLKSIMNVMALGIRQGNMIRIDAIGDDEEAAISQIEKTMKESNVV